MRDHAASRILNPQHQMNLNVCGTEADKTIREGMRTCGVGTSIAVLGGITMAVSSEGDGGYSMIGAAGIISGLAVVIVSIPIWTIGASRRSKLTESPAYKDSQPATLQITPLIENNQFNKQASLGLTASLNF